MVVNLYMHKNLFILLMFSLAINSCESQPSTSHYEPIAVVELFTSEGCSSCPPADKVLSQLTTESEKDHKKIYTLSFHVDYWDRLGWRDPFSNSQYSERQSMYAKEMKLNGVYTPQMIVNGSSELVGSDESKLSTALSKALQANSNASFNKLNVNIKEGQKAIVHYEVSGDLSDCEINFALVSKHESTAVKRGENGGHQLSHTDVVRQFITITAVASGEVSLDMPLSLDKSNMSIIAYIQRKDDLHIIAASMVNP
jgi:hypothetical protein